jgi:hypothetical protein
VDNQGAERGRSVERIGGIEMSSYGEPEQPDEWELKRTEGERQAMEWNPCELRAKIKKLEAELAVYREFGRHKDQRYRYAHHRTCEAVKKLAAENADLKKNQIPEGWVCPPIESDNGE